MIAVLSGSISEKTPSRVIVDVAGVGYDVLVPLSTFYVLGEPGAAVTLRIYTHVREDVIALYGFITAARAGPLRTADRDQRHRTEAGARRPVRHRAGGADARDPHAGRRAADAHSRGRQEDRGAHRPRAEGPAAGRPADRRTCTGGIDGGRQLRDDLLSALVNLGYQRPVAEKTVEKVLRAQPEARFEPRSRTSCVR